MKKTITAHVLVKNEDKYIFFSIMSIIEYVDFLIIYDTGSVDNTVKIIDFIISLKPEYSKKILFEKKGNVDRETIGKLRQEMIEKTSTDFFMILDGDEIWWNDSIKELVDIVNKDENALLVAQHYVNCAKDIYHYRNPARDVFSFLDKNAAATIRLYSMKIPGIHCGGYYGIEGFFDKDNNEVQCGKYNIVWQKKSYFHTSYLRRSSKQSDDIKVFSRLKKMFQAYDYEFPANYAYPEVFYLEIPEFIESPFKKEPFSRRSIIYFLLDDLKLRKLINLFRRTKFRG